MNTTFYFDTWKRFVQEGILDSARLNNLILESWYRCRKKEVNPYLKKGLHLLSKAELQDRKEKNSLFIETASPCLDKMADAIKDSGMMALLVDPEGFVLKITGNEKILNQARRINFVEGVRWTESEVGTNAIGTALQTKEAVMINGLEHYSVASHQWSCSAAPVFHEGGNLLGVIDISCPEQFSHPFMLGMVTSIGYSVEKELGRQSYRQEIVLIQQASLLAEKHGDRLFLVCNPSGIILSASKPVREKIPQAIGMHLHEIIHNRYQINAETPFLSWEDNSIKGSCCFLSEVIPNQSRRFCAAPQPLDPFFFKGECGVSEAFQAVLGKVKLVGPADITVFISGETGTGKELIAKAIHENSPRKNGPFISINCGAIPKDLMESELFGYVEGAFTGAKRQGYKGKFEQARNGTIFLDEIGEIPTTMQVALLRILQEKKVTPIGGTKEVDLDVRVITATHRDIHELVKQGEFREDLFYRLHVFPIEIPPLRNRKEDIPHLARYICLKNHWGMGNLDEILAEIKDYDWPGNIRELTNFLERTHIMLQGGSALSRPGVNTLEFLNINHPAAPPAACEEDADREQRKLKAREKIQKELMMEALKKTKGNVTAAAKLLDIPRSTFYKRLQKFGL